MIPADAHTKLLERRIHNQRVQLRWWSDWDGKRGGFGAGRGVDTYFRRLHVSMVNHYCKTKDRHHRMREALESIARGDCNSYAGDPSKGPSMIAYKALGGRHKDGVALDPELLGEPSSVITPIDGGR